MRKVSMMAESKLDLALHKMYINSQDYAVWAGEYPDWYDDKDKAWFDREKTKRYDQMILAAKEVSQQMLISHAAHIDPYKNIAWSESE
jgi:hypothetical protein